MIITRQYASRPLVDLKSLGVVVLMVGGFPLAMYAHATESLSTWLAIVVGTLLMNLSFTAWHEPSHGNFSRIGWVNTLVGIVTSWASVYPGYFARKREHLVHHKYEGVRHSDPVYERIQTNFWKFPFKVVQVALENKPWDVPAQFCAITPLMKLSDKISNYCALAVVVAGFLFGFLDSVLAVWIVPRLIVYVVHAYYVCFFPHQIATGGYQLFRVRPLGWLTRFVTVEQNYHGIHHKWPFIPWHKYARVYNENKNALSEENIEIRSQEKQPLRSQEWPA